MDPAGLACSVVAGSATIVAPPQTAGVVGYSDGVASYAVYGKATSPLGDGCACVTRADKARAFTIARGECVEAVAAIEIAVICGTAKQEDADAVARIADKLVAMLTRLIR